MLIKEAFKKDKEYLKCNLKKICQVRTDLNTPIAGSVEYLGIIGNIQFWQSLIVAGLGKKLRQALVTFYQS
jgi:hypothetical protein